jgi:hypothetical protein
MLGILAKFFVVILIVFSLSIEIAYAAFYKSFGGEIKKVEDVQKDGFKCDKLGKILSIENKRTHTPSDYFMRLGLRPWTPWSPATEQDVLGIFKSEKIIIHCERKNADGEIEEKEIYAYDIAKFGTSKR